MKAGGTVKEPDLLRAVASSDINQNRDTAAFQADQILQNFAKSMVDSIPEGEDGSVIKLDQDLE